MVDVTSKEATVREATAAALVRMEASTRALVMEGGLDKGDVLEVARIAGVMAAKRTSDLIPLCHPLALGAVDVELHEAPDGIEVRATVKTSERTGVEMEALAAVTVAGLTVYDMVKSVERGVRLTDVRLLRKSGGRSGEWLNPEG